MPTKKELLQRIVALEAQVAALSAQVAAQRPSQPYYPTPAYPYQPPLHASEPSAAAVIQAARQESLRIEKALDKSRRVRADALPKLRKAGLIR